jgi:hypothetical protein
MTENRPSDFEQIAQASPTDNALTDFWYFLKYCKKWWLLPVLLVLALFGALMLLSGTAAAPFIYTLF